MTPDELMKLVDEYAGWWRDCEQSYHLSYEDKHAHEKARECEAKIRAAVAPPAPSAEPVATQYIALCDAMGYDERADPLTSPEEHAASLLADAGRYRWLRAGIVGVTLPGASGWPAYGGRCPRIQMLRLPRPSPDDDDIDAAIDALRAALGEDR